MCTFSQFRELHRQLDQVLILVGASDLTSARLAESLGAKALAITRAAVAWSLGCHTTDQLSIETLGRVVTAIVRHVHVPVTLDIDTGWSQPPSLVGERLSPVLEAGIAGITIEDGEDGPELLARKIESIKSDTTAKGLDVFVNAQTDVYLRQMCPAEPRRLETLRRAALYRGAGADGLSAPGVVEAGHICAVASGSKLPLNVLSIPGLPCARELQRLGVRSLSTGSVYSLIIGRSLANLSGGHLACPGSQSPDWVGNRHLPIANATRRLQ
jgi:2-methylisocitrate lyase-like PEP mutase family enzyme